MTCREKLQIEHPEFVDDGDIGGCRGCPSDYGYLSDNGCDADYDMGCTECWDREIEEVPTKDDSKTIMDIVANAMKTKDMRIDLYFGDSGITCNIYPYNKD